MRMRSFGLIMTQPTSLKTPSFGFVILCPDKNLENLKNTVKSIRSVYPDSLYLCVVGNDVKKDELTAMLAICDTHKGKDTITSLINTGMKKTKSDWNVIVFAGTWLKLAIQRKFNLFAKDEKDILFSVVEGKYDFVDGSMNGIIIHKKTFAEVGDFAASPLLGEKVSEMEIVKLFWALDAIEKGCKFKAIVGMRIG